MLQSPARINKIIFNRNSTILTEDILWRTLTTFHTCTQIKTCCLIFYFTFQAVIDPVVCFSVAASRGQRGLLIYCRTSLNSLLFTGKPGTLKGNLMWQDIVPELNDIWRSQKNLCCNQMLAIILTPHHWTKEHLHYIYTVSAINGISFISIF